jgi:hypothetical protein
MCGARSAHIIHIEKLAECTRLLYLYHVGAQEGLLIVKHKLYIELGLFLFIFGTIDMLRVS